MVTLAEAVCYGWGDEAAAYSAWKKEVDQHLRTISGLDSEGMRDYPYADAFERGWEPRETALAALAFNGWERACQGCPEPTGEIREYWCLFDGESEERKVRYCSVCADLAAVNWNGCTRSVRPVEEGSGR